MQRHTFQLAVFAVTALPLYTIPQPPSYQVAMEGPQEIPSKSGYDYTFGKLMYAPQYPTYNVPSQPPTWNAAHPPQW